jgi:hypothetical protein
LVLFAGDAFDGSKRWHLVSGFTNPPMGEALASGKDQRIARAGRTSRIARF